MEGKVLSIIIPTYNMEDYISSCLDSLIVPSIDKLDIIVVNDGSKDKTSEIAYQYEKQYPKSIRVIDKENGNYGSCINVGLPLAIGKYVKILDADDTYNTPELENFIKTLSEVNVDLVLSDYVRVNPNGDVIKQFRYPIRSTYEFKFKEIFEKIKRVINMHTVCYKRSVFDELNYHQTEEISYTDEEWVFSPIINVKTVFYFNEYIYKYLLGREGQTVDPKVSQCKFGDALKGIEKMTEILLKYNNRIPFEKEKFLQNRLSARLTRNTMAALYGTEYMKYLLKNLYLNNINNWRNIGVDPVSLTTIPIIRYSCIKCWIKHNYDLKYKPPKLYDVYRTVLYYLHNSWDHYLCLNRKK